MGSQFVDFNADGRIDYFTATFDGSPHVAYGTEDGFAEPVRLMDASGKRVMLDQYWDYDAKKWSNSGSDNGQCTSAVAFDWDADGDFDLLLGDYNGGNLYLQINEGKPGEPKFTGTSEPVLAGGRPFALHGGMTAPRLVDWDGDGLTDLVCGSYGDSYTSKPPGGVYWYRNTGSTGAPEFAAAATLIPPTATTGTEADRPNVGLYADPVDYDGDGDLDLLVGGYSIWMPKVPELTAAEEARAKKLEKEIELAEASIAKQRDAEAEKIQAEKLDDDEASKRMSEFYNSASFRKLNDSRRELSAELKKYRPTQERQAGVWIYLRK